MKRKIINVLGTVLLLLIFTALPSGAAAAPNPQVKLEPGKFSRMSEKGLFKVLMVIEGKELAVAANSLNLIIRDRHGKEITGAEVAVTPWMPEHGHGVWEKPVVSEREKGNYRVENIVLIMAGRWDLKIAVKKGAEEDLAVFSFLVGAAGGATPVSSQQPEKYSRTLEDYKVPNVTLLNQNGEKIRLRTLLESDKPVIIDFIFTSCTTICPILSAGFSGLRDELGRDADRVQLVSISIDPEHDRPQQMKQYLKRYNSGAGWELLTGSRTDINQVLKAFDAYVPDKMSHRPIYILHGPNSDKWVRINGLLGKSDLVKELRNIENQ